MLEEQSTTEVIKKPEAQENPEAIQSIESPEELRQQILSESEGEAEGFKKEGSEELAQAEARAAAEGLVIDSEDSTALLGLNQEADKARAVLAAETGIGIKSQEVNSLVGSEKNPQANTNSEPTFDEAQEKIKEEFFKDMREAREDAERRFQIFKNEFEECNKKISELEEKIETIKSSFVRRLFSNKEVKKLGLDLALVKMDADHSTYRMESETDSITNFDKILEEEAALKALKQQEEAFLLEQEQREADERARSVENLMEKNNCFFIHSIAHLGHYKPSENNKSISAELDFVSQVEVVAGIQPTVSASTIRPDTMDGIFGGNRWGIFLKGGKVLGGEEDDMGTVASKKFERSGIRGTKPEDIEKAISRPNSPTNLSKDDYYSTDPYGQKVLSKRSGGYNELAVKNPEVAGIYLTYDVLEAPSSENFQNNGRASYDSWWEEVGKVKKMNLPLYILTRNNHVYGISNVDMKARKFDVLPEVTPQDVIDGGGISASDRAVMLSNQSKNLKL